MSDVKFTWGTVTALSPLRVTLDGDSSAVPFTPDSLIDPLSLAVNDRVRCELSGRRLIVHGRGGGLPQFPPGVVANTAAGAAPTGWLLCNGSPVSRTTYPELFAAIGTTYGAGDGTTTFNLPDMRGRVPVGRDTGQTEFDTLGQAGGAKTHTLTVSEIPPHSHLIGRVQVGQSGTNRPLPSDNTPDSTSSTQQTGGGAAHNNLQPYRVLNFIIKT